MLLVVLPMIHITQWQGLLPAWTTLGLACLPLTVILFTLVRPSPWTAVWLFPVSHLPVLVQEPELSGALVYSGVEGLIALLMVLCFGAAWMLAAMRLIESPRISPRGQGVSHFPMAPIPFFTTLSALSIWVTFVWPVLGAAQAGRSQASALVLGTASVVIIIVSGRWISREIGGMYGDTQRRRQWLVELLRERQPRSGRLSMSLAATVSGTLMVLALFR